MSFIKIPTYNCKTKTQDYTEFATREAFNEFLRTIYKEPGKYEFDEDSLIFNTEARKFLKTKVYCVAPMGSSDFKDYWDDQKEKCRTGFIINSSRGKTWYLTRYYYMWINFLPIYHKEQGKFSFPDVRDVQYHLALYEDKARYAFKHAAVLKKRQIASSYFHAGVIINNYWFEEGLVNKIAGSLKDYINEKGTWRFLEEYRNFLNEHTAWYRPSNPDKVLNWEQKIETTVNGKKIDKGNKSTVMGLVLEKNPSNGVGGPCGFFFHEEAGIAPQMNKTLEYLLPALKSGMIYTGWFAAAGSVGDLEQCDPLKELILNPKSKDVFAVETNLLNKEGDKGMCGLFLPEQWSMPPCIDEFGNSLVEKALDMIMEERLQWKKDLSPEDYQLRVSQKPINIEEAFAYRKASKFPLHLVNAQIRRIRDKEYFMEYVNLEPDENGKIQIRPTNKIPIREFPVSPKTQDKEGVVVIYERPVPNPSFGTYYASIDPVSEGKTTTSDSLCSIFIMKAPQEVTIHKEDGSVENYIDPEKMVASWCGRFDDIKKTHQRLEYMIELYNAWTIVENNISLFIQHMISRKKQKYLVPKDQIMFLKELKSNSNVYQEYGWKNTGTLFKTNLLSYGVEYLKEEVDTETKTNGDIVRVKYGVERIPDEMLLEEMKSYTDGLNVDRLVAFCALVAFMRVQFSNRGYNKRTEHSSTSNLQNSDKNSKLSISPFRHMGKTGNNQSNPYKHSRNPFRNIK
jgi:hypothetical protein